MPMVSTGPISLGGSATTGGLNQSVNIELGRGATTTINMNETAVRTLAGVPSGAISMNNFYGKSNRVTVNLTIAGNTQNYNIFNNRGGGYVAGRTDVVLTINSGVVVGSSSTGAFALTTGSGWAAGDAVRINNNGRIVGRAGNGGIGGQSNPGAPGGGGGPALQLTVPTQIQNNSIIGGGGGGGTGGNGLSRGGGGGGGGGGNTAGSGADGGFGSASPGNPGAGGNVSSGGPGGAGGGVTGGGGPGGGPGVAGSPGSGQGGGGGGGNGAGGGRGGGGGGAATSGGPTFATYLATGTRYGALN